VELARDATVKDACRKIGVTEHTYYRWRRECGRLKLDQAKRLKQLEKENARLKKLVAMKELDLSILKEVAEGNF
jgi:putative transposase